MIDYYLHKKCPLVMPTAKQIENVRCNGCIWLDKNLHKCLFALKFPRVVSLEEFERRIESVNESQQNNLTETFRRFVQNGNKKRS